MGSVSVWFGILVGIPWILVINLLVSSPGIILPRDNYSQKSTNQISEIPVGVQNSSQNRWGSVKTSCQHSHTGLGIGAYRHQKEEIYIRPPRGVLKPGQEGKVLRLLKGLYGLKQAGQGWYMQMSKVFMNEMGFKWSAIDPSVFYQRTRDEHTIVAVAMDNMAVTSKQIIDIECFKSKVKEFWDVMDHGPIKWFLGFEIK